MTSAATPKGTYCFAAVMESSSFTGSISWWYIETATKAAGRQSEAARPIRPIHLFQ